ncbi:MAG: 16S rRNA processing protein RimM [Gammaproteobacteria bacterium]|nr:16S rRNA processing protein RimM [Gammaproteobacteria bacterium]
MRNSEFNFASSSESETQARPHLVTIGEIIGVHGVKGQLRIRSFTEPHETILDYFKNSELYWNYGNKDKSWSLIPQIKNAKKVDGNNFIISLTNCVDRNQARLYQFTEIGINRSELPPLPQDQYYWADLESLAVYTTYNSKCLYLGQVDHLFTTGSNDVLVVKSDTKEYLIPYILDQFVTSVDLFAKKILVDWDPNF